MSTVELKLKEQVQNVGVRKIEKTESPVTSEERTETMHISDDDEDNYIFKQINRIP
jgi:hypothetical protein